MQNAAVAQMFDEIADCLEIAGENPFRVRAYRRAAESVANFSSPIEDAAEAGTLNEIEGLGEATTLKVREFLATGRVRFLERLKEEYPPSLLELLRVPGLGPKRIKLLREQGITSLDELVTALESNALAGVTGFGGKTLQNLQAGIERLATMTTRLPLGEARRVGGEIATALRDKSGARVEVAGSLRRGCDTVGDINFLAQSDEPVTVVDAFLALPSVLSEEARDETSATVRVRPGVEARLFCAASSVFGAAQLRATGSREHWDEAVRRAASRGLELRDDGLFQNGVLLPSGDEAQVYEALGVPFIAPELRENKGEWGAAEAGNLPRLLELGDIRGDLHAHSTWSDGSVSIRGMAEAMSARDYEYFAVTDHSKALAMANGLNAARLRQQAEEIAQVREAFPHLTILRGVECDILRDGTLDLDDEILHELDWVVASVHSAFNLPEAAQTERMIRALTHPAVKLLAHPTGRILGGRPGYAVHVPALIEAARDTRTALEINASERLDLSDENAFLARQFGVPLCINSDAHSLRMLPNVELGVLTARRAWCEAKDVLNAKPVRELLAWLNRP